jgi:NAD(P)H dehydrogenase (quinone)
MRIAVTGGTGRIGGRVVELLTGAGGHEVVALSSRTAPYDNPSALRAALDGVDTLVFVSSDGEAARVIVHHRNVVQAATQCRVGHVVLLSGLDVDLQSPFATRTPTATPSDCSAPPAARTQSSAPACLPSSS